MGFDHIAIFDLVAWCAGRSDSDGWLLCQLLSNESIVISVATLEAVVLLLPVDHNLAVQNNE